MNDVPRIVVVVVWAVVLVFGAFVAGRAVGHAEASCYMIDTNASAFKTDPAYWGESMRTVVEACERGERP